MKCVAQMPEPVVIPAVRSQLTRVNPRSRERAEKA